MKQSDIDYIVEAIEYQQHNVKCYESTQTKINDLKNTIYHLQSEMKAIDLLDEIQVIIKLLQKHTQENITWFQNNVGKLETLIIGEKRIIDESIKH